MISSFDLSLPAGQPVRVNVGGAFFRLLSGAGIDVRFMRGGAVIGEADGMDSGFFARTNEGERFDGVELTSAGLQSAKVLIGEAEAGAASAVSVSGVVGVQSAGVPYAQAAVTVAVTSGVLVAANADRRFLMVQNNHASQNIWLNLAGAAATQAAGVKVPPGGALLLDVACPTGAVYAIGETGNNAAVVVVEG